MTWKRIEDELPPQGVRVLCCSRDRCVLHDVHIAAWRGKRTTDRSALVMCTDESEDDWLPADMWQPLPPHPSQAEEVT